MLQKLENLQQEVKETIQRQPIYIMQLHVRAQCWDLRLTFTCSAFVLSSASLISNSSNIRVLFKSKVSIRILCGQSFSCHISLDQSPNKENSSDRNLSAAGLYSN